MDHFAPSSSISTTAGHHALQSPECQGTFSLWKGALGKSTRGGGDVLPSSAVEN